MATPAETFAKLQQGGVFGACDFEGGDAYQFLMVSPGGMYYGVRRNTERKLEIVMVDRSTLAATTGGEESAAAAEGGPEAVYFYTLNDNVKNAYKLTALWVARMHKQRTGTECVTAKKHFAR